MDTREAFLGIDFLLQDALELIDRVNNQSSVTLRTVETVDDILAQIEVKTQEIHVYILRSYNLFNCRHQLLTFFTLKMLSRISELWLWL